MTIGQNGKAHRGAGNLQTKSHIAVKKVLLRVGHERVPTALGAKVYFLFMENVGVLRGIGVNGHAADRIHGML